MLFDLRRKAGGINLPTAQFPLFSKCGRNGRWTMRQRFATYCRDGSVRAHRRCRPRGGEACIQGKSVVIPVVAACDCFVPQHSATHPMDGSAVGN